MKMRLIQAAKAVGAFNELGNQMLPGRVAKAIYDNKKMLMEQVEFLISEESKLVSAFGAVGDKDQNLHVEGDKAKNEEFITRMRDLQNMEVEIHPVVIDEDFLLQYAQITPNNIALISYIFAVPEPQEGEAHD